jgi:hypothetical protein
VKTVVSILVVLFALVSPLSQTPAHAESTPADAKPTDAELDAEAADARQRVIEIVNQPITHLPRTREAATFSPGWFHPGAIQPDFNTVDVRTTQEFTYESYTYVTSDLNPSEMFIASELEFNSMTKYFYTDRTLPKKRLSDAEMLEINRLYRIIGRDEQSLSARRALAWAVGLGAVLAASLLLLFGQTLSRGVQAVLGRPPSRGRTGAARSG